MKGELSIRKAVPGKALKKKKQGNDYVECLNFDLSRVAGLVHHALVSSDNDSLVAKDFSDCKGLVEKVGAISSFSYVQKVLMKAEEHYAALSVLMEINSENSPSQRFEEVPRDDSFHLKDSTGYEEKLYLKSISVIRRELPESALGWPILQRTNRPALEALRRSEVRNRSLVEWNSKENNSSSDLKTDDSIVRNARLKGL
ncbi:hypothetical protein NC653_015122 [Populus alba x Populus x berolinensis]|uniref:Uncharacterized protein n=1 Tax=Populus alba x Populus x berolinensis TaxID=444605 RepID=A0AAD6W4G5_9ROSI|nr:hypothetical protein NC653_014874 [Populus alba x Populus x berolinensis]KAJ6999184.1 hypothetical protein NC653_015122 [Populus alba x Populus x berolinensis]